MRETIINTSTAAVYHYRNLPARISNSRCLTFHQAAPIPSATNDLRRNVQFPSGEMTWAKYGPTVLSTTQVFWVEGTSGGYGEIKIHVRIELNEATTRASPKTSHARLCRAKARLLFILSFFCEHPSPLASPAASMHTQSLFLGLVDQRNQVRRNVELLHSPRKQSAIFPLDQNHLFTLHTDVSANPK